VTLADSAGGQHVEPVGDQAGAPARRWELDEEVVVAHGQALLVEYSEDTGLVRR
jgi:hypothetical protein